MGCNDRTFILVLGTKGNSILINSLQGIFDTLGGEIDFV